MKKPDAIFLLNEKILQKEFELAEERVLLKDRFRLTMESLKPINLIKNTLSSPGLQHGLLDAAIGMTTGYLAKKTIVRSSHNPLVKLTGSIFQIVVTSLVAKNPNVIKLIGGTILKKIFSMKKADPQNIYNGN